MMWLGLFALLGSCFCLGAEHADELLHSTFKLQHAILELPCVRWCLTGTRHGGWSDAQQELATHSLSNRTMKGGMGGDAASASGAAGVERSGMEIGDERHVNEDGDLSTAESRRGSLAPSKELDLVKRAGAPSRQTPLTHGDSFEAEDACAADEPGIMGAHQRGRHAATDTSCHDETHRKLPSQVASSMEAIAGSGSCTSMPRLPYKAGQYEQEKHEMSKVEPVTRQANKPVPWLYADNLHEAAEERRKQYEERKRQVRACSCVNGTRGIDVGACMQTAMGVTTPDPADARFHGFCRSRSSCASTASSNSSSAS